MAVGLVVLALAATLAGCAQPGASTAAKAPAAAQSEPRLVTQFAHEAPVIAVHWIRDGKTLVSLDGDGGIVLWDVAARAVIDQAQVPIPKLMAYYPTIRFERFEPGSDAGHLNLRYRYATHGWSDTPLDLCPAPARGTDLSCTYALDLEARTVRAAPDAAAPQAADAAATDPMPASPDGRWRPVGIHGNGARSVFEPGIEHPTIPDPACRPRKRCRYGIGLLPASGTGAQIPLVGEPRIYFAGAKVSDDGRRLARMEIDPVTDEPSIGTLNLVTGQAGPTTRLSAMPYHGVAWVSEDRIAALSHGYNVTDDTENSTRGLPPTRLVDPACAGGSGCASVPAYWQMQPLDDAGSFIGVGSITGCYEASRITHVWCPGARIEADGNTTAIPPSDGISLYRPGKGWRLMAQPDWGSHAITAIALAPDRQRLAVATREWAMTAPAGPRQILRVALFGVNGDSLLPSGPPVIQLDDALAKGREGFDDEGTIAALSFTPDGRYLMFARSQPGAEPDAVIVVDSSGENPPRTIPTGSGIGRAPVALAADRVFAPDTGHVIALESGRILQRTATRAEVLDAGVVARSGLFWTAGEDGVIRFRDTRDGSAVLNLTMLPGGHWFAMTPQGRFDTDLGPDSEAVRWTVPDSRWQTLAPQTFMRDYYEPGLVARVLDCRQAGNCAEVFAPLPPIAMLNHVLPQVRIVAVERGASADEAVVTIEAEEGHDPAAANGKTNSGLYNLRLFRNDRLVAIVPGAEDRVGETIGDWRARNRIAPDMRRVTLRVPLPTGAGAARQVFSAYAFNEDRIKGATARLAYTRPPVPRRPPRAYVIALGIDAYAVDRLRLRYAVADARLMAQRLDHLPGHEMRRLVVAGEQRPDGTRQELGRSAMAQVLSLLDARTDRKAVLAALARAGIDGSPIEPSTPDDMVFISYAGHGWADPQGNFYLVPSTVRWPDAGAGPDRSTLFATADFTRALATISAAEITLVIDACHSAASVDSRFKPGPMGDSGLGQLAFDKGIRILAATQASDVAMEDERLGQGLLTYALAAEGLTARGGRADADGDASISLQEWLRYPLDRLPQLAREMRDGRSGARAIVFHDLPPDAPQRQVQRPALFDFTTRADPVPLRRVSR